jgi:flagellar basal body rod protein FlgC
VAVPNVDTTSELIDGMQASLTYKANASVLRTAGDMAGTLFDILG